MAEASASALWPGQWRPALIPVARVPPLGWDPDSRRPWTACLPAPISLRGWAALQHLLECERSCSGAVTLWCLGPASALRALCMLRAPDTVLRKVVGEERTPHRPAKGHWQLKMMATSWRRRNRIKKQKIPFC